MILAFPINELSLLLYYSYTHTTLQKTTKGQPIHIKHIFSCIS